jgi:hypothetical protein
MRRAKTKFGEIKSGLPLPVFLSFQEVRTSVSVFRISLEICLQPRTGLNEKYHLRPYLKQNRNISTNFFAPHVSKRQQTPLNSPQIMLICIQSRNSTRETILWTQGHMFISMVSCNLGNPSSWALIQKPPTVVQLLNNFPTFS